MNTILLHIRVAMKPTLLLFSAGLQDASLSTEGKQPGRMNLTRRATGVPQTYPQECDEGAASPLQDSNTF